MTLRAGRGRRPLAQAPAHVPAPGHPVYRPGLPIRYSHTNIVARDPARLSAFYVDVLGCVAAGPPRDLRGEWLGRGMGLPGARVRGVHLLLPGHGDQGPALELFSLDDLEGATPPTPRRPGLMHVAFSVDDIGETVERVLAAGGSLLGEVSQAVVAGVGRAAFVYTRDPEGNIVELQQWHDAPAGTRG